MGLKSFRSALLLGAAALGMSAASAALTSAYAQEATRTYAIEPQELDDALREFGRQTGRDILFAPDAAAGKRSPGVEGQMTERQALEALLEGTGLTFQQTASNGYAVQDPASPTRLGAADTGAEEVIVVTGTRIRGQRPIGSSPQVYESEDIDRSGYSTTQDFLTALPQNFGGNNTAINTGSGNTTRGTTVNLRGLGLGSTLILVNGIRQTTSGDNGDFVDVSALPVTAIERVEILADGASALYGSDAVGGVVNFVLRSDYDGAETRYRYGAADGFVENRFSQVFGRSWRAGSALLGYQYYERGALATSDRDYAASADKSPFGGTDFRNTFSNPGNILVGANIYGIPSNQDGTNLTASDLQLGVANLGDIRTGVDLQPEITTESAFGSFTWSPFPNVEWFADARYGTRDIAANNHQTQTTLTAPSSNPFYVSPVPGGAPVLVGYDFTADFGSNLQAGSTEFWSVDLGGRFDLSETWRLTIFGAHARNTEHTVTPIINFTALFAALADSNPMTAFNPFGDGSFTNPTTLALLRSQAINHTESSLSQFNAVADGTLFQVPAGSVRLAAGVDYRFEELESSRGRGDPLSREVMSAFGELSLPLIRGGVEGDSPLVELSLAGRSDRYSDFGDTFNPKVGVEVSPSQHLTIRGQWGTSFRAPNLIDLNTNVIGGLNVLVLPLPSPTGSVPGLVRFGSNPDLQPETSESWSLGADLEPQWWTGLTLSATYYDIEYEDKIITPGPPGVTSILFQEQLWADFVDRTPSAADLAALCPLAISGSCVATPPAVIVDGRRANAALVATSGIDLNATQRFETDVGDVSLGLQATYVLDFEQQASRTSPVADLLDTKANPTSWRLRALFGWDSGPWSANVTYNFVNSYTDNSLTPNREVDAWETTDLSLRFRGPENAGWLGGITLALNATNVFDEDPPFVNDVIGFDPTNATALGRVVSLELSKQW